MSRRRLLLGVGALVLLVVGFALLFGVMRPIPGPTMKGITLFKLEVLCQAIQEFDLNDLAQYKSVQEFVAIARTRHVVSAEPPEYYDTDGWERSFKWESAKTDGKLIIRIISAGSNGGFGDDDDLYLRAEISRHKPYNVQIKS